MFVWDRAGSIQRYEVAVQRDLARLAADVKQLLPGEPIEVRGNGKFVVLSGTVSTKEVAEKRGRTSPTGFVEQEDEVVTLLQVQPGPPTPQVLLRVRFAEVSRAALTEFGMSLFTSPTGINNTVGRVTTQQFQRPGFSDLEWSKASSEFGAPVTSASGKFSFSDFLNFFLLSQRYDLGLMIRAHAAARALPEPGRAEPRGRERQGSELPRRRRVPGPGRAGYGGNGTAISVSSRSSASA